MLIAFLSFSSVIPVSFARTETVVESIAGTLGGFVSGFFLPGLGYAPVYAAHTGKEIYRDLFDKENSLGKKNFQAASDRNYHAHIMGVLLGFGVNSFVVGAVYFSGGTFLIPVAVVNTYFASLVVTGALRNLVKEDENGNYVFDEDAAEVLGDLLSSLSKGIANLENERYEY